MNTQQLHFAIEGKTLWPRGLRPKLKTKYPKVLVIQWPFRRQTFSIHRGKFVTFIMVGKGLNWFQISEARDNLNLSTEEKFAVETFVRAHRSIWLSPYARPVTPRPLDARLMSLLS